jgi:SAM-dependent methyltransferase
MNSEYTYDGKKFSKEELTNFLKKIRGNPGSRTLKILKMLENKFILDVGCAEGILSKTMAQKGFQVTGIDVLENSIKIAKEFDIVSEVKFEIRDLLKEPFKEESFDCITFLETIEHVESPGMFLREFSRILKPGGCLILSTPNATSLKNVIYALSYRKKNKRKELAKEISNEDPKTGTHLEHIYNWDFPTLIRLLDRCGFDLVEHVFIRSGPIVIPIFGKKIKLINLDSNLLKYWSPLMTGHVLKARKKSTG